MFNFMLKHKRGFTLVELMIVVVLMGFGVIALANLFQGALRTFNKTEERYMKQEMVKSVAEYLQYAVNIGSATKAEIYPDSSVVPTVAGSDNSYAYIYVQKEDRDEDGKLDGYYLYVLERGQAKADGARCLNPEVPLYITFSAYRDYDYVGASEVMNQCGVKVKIAATDSDYKYKEDAYFSGSDSTEAQDIEDYIFFDTTVSYHFPNMVTSNDLIRVNFNGNARDKANVYSDSGKTGTTVDSVDIDGHVLRITSESSISADGAASAISVSSFCFIATAGYGEATGEVGILCEFRDKVLKTNPLGRMFVKAYYAVSPPIADFISESEPLKAAVRVGLKPLVAVAVYALEPNLLVEQLPFVIMGVGSGLGLGAVGVYTYRKRKIEE